MGTSVKARVRTVNPEATGDLALPPGPNPDKASANRRWWYISSVNAAERRAARASWEGRVFRNGWEEMADFDALFWDRLPVGERAEAVWELSKELHAIAHPETHERRLPRSAYRVERR